jgi:glycosyltransferase involved in cell wall biosynthesis
LDATIVIVTKDRLDVLREAVRTSLQQDAAVLVVDDGSTDGTSSVIAREFPNVQVSTSHTNLGLIEQRDRAIRAATTEFVVVLDDDAAFDRPGVLAETLREFTHERIGVIAMTPDPGVPLVGQHVVAAFVGWAHVLRRGLFVQAGGYRGDMLSHGEERDLSMRLLGGGYVVLQGRIGGVTHYPYPSRNGRRASLFGRRNDIVNAWCNVPRPYMLLHMAGVVVKSLWLGRGSGFTGTNVHGLARGFTEIASGRWKREPVSRDTYRRWRRLVRMRSLPLSDFLRELDA